MHKIVSVGAVTKSLSGKGSAPAQGTITVSSSRSHNLLSAPTTYAIDQSRGGFRKEITYCHEVHSSRPGQKSMIMYRVTVCDVVITFL